MKRKIFTNLPFVVIGIFLIIYISFGVVYLQKQGEFQSLGSQMSLQRTILQKQPTDIEKLRSQLTEAKTEFGMTLTSLPNSGQRIDIYSVLVDLGRNSNAEILSIAVSPPIKAKGGKDNITIVPYSLTVKGSQGDILDFISSLIQGTELLQGLELESVSIQNGTSPDNPATLELELYIHTWPDFTSGEQGVPQIPGSKK